MKILALDIGAGTEDVLLFDDNKKNVENCVKLVLPSPSSVFATKVNEATTLYKDVFVKGDIIGGGAFSSALRNHVKKGFRVMMTANAAYTIANDLDEVSKLGIEIIRGDNIPGIFEGETITTEEVNVLKLREFLAAFNEPFLDVDVVAVAVQDHGVSPKGMSNRRFRIQNMKDLLKDNPTLETLAFKGNEIPPCFLRMRSAAIASKRQMPKAKVLLMDTAPDAILGCLRDSVVQKAGSVLVVNVGNGHTTAAIISNKKIVGAIEHHTQLLTPKKIEHLLVNFADGKLTDDDVFKDKGHGLFFLSQPPGFSKIGMIVATGPNRSILAKTDFAVHFASPGGDVMMTGPLGLVEATKNKFRFVD